MVSDTNFIEAVTIRPVKESDLPTLEAHFPSSRPLRHRAYWRLQERGWITNLTAWLDDRPIGQGTIRWLGPRDAGVAVAYPKCPEILGFFVVEALQSQGIGTRMLDWFEAETRKRNLARIGLAVAVANTRAQALYRRCGYRVANVETYLDRWYWLDETGSKMWVADECQFMIKEL